MRILPAQMASAICCGTLEFSRKRIARQFKRLLQ
jgi:hypothetical protein